ncbi:hypothetical protein ABFX02_10G123100 [Erythranthe guttata]
MKNRENDVLPYDMIEIILLQLPVKSLLRFKSVSKSWEATISDRKFAANHLRQSKKKNDSFDDGQDDLLLWVGKSSMDFLVFNLDPSKNCRWEMKSLSVLCYCDGLVLLHRHLPYDGSIYRLWNPSSKSEVNISCDPRIHRGGGHDYADVAQGLYYDQSVEDYKIVVTDMKNRYSIYRMRKKLWSDEMKEMEIDIPGEVVWCDKGSSFEGDTYWVVRTRASGKEESFLVCFDSKREKFEKWGMPIGDNDDCKFYLTYLGSRLCLAYSKTKMNQLWFVKRVAGGGSGSAGSWVEFEEAMPLSRNYIKPLRLTNDKEIAREDGWRKSYTMYEYNVVTKTCAEIHVTTTPNGGYPQSPLYLENMFFSSTKSNDDVEESTN